MSFTSIGKTLAMFSNVCLGLCLSSNCGDLTEVVPGAKDDDDGVLALQSLLHILFVQHVPHHHPGSLVVIGQLGGIPHQHRHIVSWGGINGETAAAFTKPSTPCCFQISSHWSCILSWVISHIFYNNAARGNLNVSPTLWLLYIS